MKTVAAPAGLRSKASGLLKSVVGLTILAMRIASDFVFAKIGVEIQNKNKKKISRRAEYFGGIIVSSMRGYFLKRS